MPGIFGRLGHFIKKHDPLMGMIGSTMPGGRNSPGALLNKTPMGAAMGAMPGMGVARNAMNALPFGGPHLFGGGLKRWDKQNAPRMAAGVPPPTGGIDTAPTGMQASPTRNMPTTIQGSSQGGNPPWWNSAMKPMPPQGAPQAMPQQGIPQQGSIWNRYMNNTGVRGPMNFGGGGYGGY